MQTHSLRQAYALGQDSTDWIQCNRLKNRLPGSTLLSPLSLKQTETETETDGELQNC